MLPARRRRELQQRDIAYRSGLVASIAHSRCRSLRVSIVLFGCGSRMIVDVEESCARLGLEVAAIVKNVEGADHALARERLISVDEVGPALLACRYMLPFFTPGNRLAARQHARARGFTDAATVVDPTAVVAASATIGPGTYVNSAAAIGGAARIGDFAFINRSASIGHHAEIDDFASVGPGAILCGSVRLGRGAVAAAGAIILENLQIGRNSVVAAGAVVRESVADRCLVAGNPARIVKTDYAGYRNFLV
jgi:acetyltransferase-like isoleucine patch superfamily enzyme